MRSLQRRAARRRLLGLQQHERPRGDDPGRRPEQVLRRRPQDRKPADDLRAGHQVGAFQTPFDASGGNLVWTLSGKTATASAGSKACNPTVELRKVTVPADDPGVFQLRINNAVVATGGNGTTSGQLADRASARAACARRPGPGRTSPTTTRRSSAHGTARVEVSVPGTKVDGTIAQGDTVVCTFTNTRKGTPPATAARRTDTADAARPADPAAGAADAAGAGAAARPRRHEVGRARRSSPSAGGSPGR